MDWVSELTVYHPVGTGDLAFYWVTWAVSPSKALLPSAWAAVCACVVSVESCSAFYISAFVSCCFPCLFIVCHFLGLAFCTSFSLFHSCSVMVSYVFVSAFRCMQVCCRHLLRAYIFPACCACMSFARCSTISLHGNVRLMLRLSGHP